MKVRIYKELSIYSTVILLHLDAENYTVLVLILQSRTTRRTVHNWKTCCPTFCSVLFNLSVDTLSTKPNIEEKLIIEVNLLILGQTC